MALRYAPPGLAEARYAAERGEWAGRRRPVWGRSEVEVELELEPERKAQQVSQLGL